MILKKPVDEEMENTLDKLQEEYNEFKEALSQARRQEFETYFIDVRMQEYTALVKLVRAEYNLNDLERLRKYLRDLKRDLAQAKQGNPFGNIIHLIREAYQLLRNGNEAEARQVYVRIMAIYKDLDPEMRRIVYQPCRDIHDKISDGWTGEKDFQKLLAEG